jgi:curved DNA-binding protein CbpA
LKTSEKPRADDVRFRRACSTSDSSYCTVHGTRLLVRAFLCTRVDALCPEQVRGVKKLSKAAKSPHGDKGGDPPPPGGGRPGAPVQRHLTAAPPVPLAQSPPGTMARLSREDAYAALGVAPGASEDEVNKAFRLLSLQHHPDKVQCTGEAEQGAAHERFVLISNARDRLLADESDEDHRFGRDSDEDDYEEDEHEFAFEDFLFDCFLHGSDWWRGDHGGFSPFVDSDGFGGGSLRFDSRTSTFYFAASATGAGRSRYPPGGTFPGRDVPRRSASVHSECSDEEVDFEHMREGHMRQSKHPLATAVRMKKSYGDTQQLVDTVGGAAWAAQLDEYENNALHYCAAFEHDALVATAMQKCHDETMWKAAAERNKMEKLPWELVADQGGELAALLEQMSLKWEAHLSKQEKKKARNKKKKENAKRRKKARTAEEALAAAKSTDEALEELTKAETAAKDAAADAELERKAQTEAARKATADAAFEARAAVVRTRHAAEAEANAANAAAAGAAAPVAKTPSKSAASSEKSRGTRGKVVDEAGPLAGMDSVSTAAQQRKNSAASDDTAKVAEKRAAKERRAMAAAEKRAAAAEAAAEVQRRKEEAAAAKEIGMSAEERAAQEKADARARANEAKTQARLDEIRLQAKAASAAATAAVTKKKKKKKKKAKASTGGASSCDSSRLRDVFGVDGVAPGAEDCGIPGGGFQQTSGVSHAGSGPEGESGQTGGHPSAEAGRGVVDDDSGDWQEFSETTVQEVPAGVLCVNGCVYFGSPETLNLCSQCFSDYLRRLSPVRPSSPTRQESPVPSVNAQFEIATSEPRYEYSVAHGSAFGVKETVTHSSSSTSVVQPPHGACGSASPSQPVSQPRACSDPRKEWSSPEIATVAMPAVDSQKVRPRVSTPAAALCRAYSCTGKCARAKICRYRHVRSAGVDARAAAASQESSVVKLTKLPVKGNAAGSAAVMPVCLNFAKDGRCRYGPKCHFAYSHKKSPLRESLKLFDKPSSRGARVSVPKAKLASANGVDVPLPNLSPPQAVNQPSAEASGRQSGMKRVPGRQQNDSDESEHIWSQEEADNGQTSAARALGEVETPSDVNMEFIPRIASFSSIPKKTTGVCRAFASKGRCKYGDRCHRVGSHIGQATGGEVQTAVLEQPSSEYVGVASARASSQAFSVGIDAIADLSVGDTKETHDTRETEVRVCGMFAKTGRCRYGKRCYNADSHHVPQSSASYASPAACRDVKSDASKAVSELSSPVTASNAGPKKTVAVSQVFGSTGRYRYGSRNHGAFSRVSLPEKRDPVLSVGSVSDGEPATAVPAGVSNKGMNLCRNFTKSGTCRFGRRCHYAHVPLPMTSDSTASSLSGLASPSTVIRAGASAFCVAASADATGECIEAVHQPKPATKQPCRAFMAGHCTRGASCWYFHAVKVDGM